MAQLEFLLSIGLGMVFTTSALPKLRRPKSFLITVSTYELLPSAGNSILTSVLPPTELVLGLLLLTGTYLHLASVVASALLAGFILSVAIALKKGPDIDCGCYPGRPRRLSWRLLVEDSGLFVASLTVVAISGTSHLVEDWSPAGRLGPPVLGAILALMLCSGTAAQVLRLVSRPRRNVSQPLSFGGDR